MTEPLDGWELHYSKHRQPWAGTVHDIPSMPRGSRVLEAGCGNGKFLKELLKNNIHITAFDFSENAVKTCSDLSYSNKERKAELLAADCRCLPFRDAVFDAAFYRHITGHITDKGRNRSSEECVRVLKEEGFLYFTGFSVEDLRAGKGTHVEDNSYLRGNGIITHYFTEEEVRGLFQDLKEISLKTVRWNMRIRGEDHTRAEINAVFQKFSR